MNLISDDPGEDEELEEALLVGGKFKYRLEHLDSTAGRTGLRICKKDKDQLSILLNAAQNVTPATDAKLTELKRLICGKVTKPTTNKLGEPNKKFSFSPPLPTPPPTFTIRCSIGPTKNSASTWPLSAAEATPAPRSGTARSTRS